MAKPIALIRLNHIDDESMKKRIHERFNTLLNDYHVIMSYVYLDKDIDIEVYNDVSGLIDADINELIKELK